MWSRPHSSIQNSTWYHAKRDVHTKNIFPKRYSALRYLSLGFMICYLPQWACTCHYRNEAHHPILHEEMYILRLTRTSFLTLRFVTLRLISLKFHTGIASLLLNFSCVDKNQKYILFNRALMTELRFHIRSLLWITCKIISKQLFTWVWITQRWLALALHVFLQQS